MTPPTASDFQQELDRIFRAAQDQHLTYVDVRSGDLHRALGGYPGPNNDAIGEVARKESFP